MILRSRAGNRDICAVVDSEYMRLSVIRIARRVTCDDKIARVFRYICYAVEYGKQCIEIRPRNLSFLLIRQVVISLIGRLHLFIGRIQRFTAA